MYDHTQPSESMEGGEYDDEESDEHGSSVTHVSSLA